MKVINPYFGSTLIESIVAALKNPNGNRLDVGVGYAQNLTQETFVAFGSAVETWLDLDERHKFRLFIGDHRHRLDSPTQSKGKVKTSTEVAAKLIQFAPGVEDRIEIVFVQRLHAKFYSMWSFDDALGDHLEWAIVGSSNLTDAALAEKNIELDIYLEPGDEQLDIIQNQLKRVIDRLYSDGAICGLLHDTIDDLAAKSRWEFAKLRDSEECIVELDAELQTEEAREAEDQARRESDKQLGILGSK